MNATSPRPCFGHGVGLRRRHWPMIVDHHPGVDFFELLTENFLGLSGPPGDVLDRLVGEVPLLLHGTSLSIAGTEPLKSEYLDALDALCRRVQPAWFSDHLCMSTLGPVETHELLPVPFTEAVLDHVVERIERVQDRIGRPFLIENPSYYTTFAASDVPEAEFYAALVERSGCGLLLDVNNVYVNARNHGGDPLAFIRALPLDRVLQIHLAGHFDRGDLIIDTHGAPIIEPVLALYAETLRLTGPVSTLVEWDNDLPPAERLLEENDRVRAVAARALDRPGGLPVTLDPSAGSPT